MSEAIHRILPSTLLGCHGPWVFVSAAQDRTYTSFEKLPGFARDVLAFLGVKASEFRVVTENTIADRLFVAEQGSELSFGPKPGYLADLDEYTTPRLDALHGNEPRFCKVYVSRHACVGNFLGEEYLEDQLKAEGFSIIRPETLPVSVQMDIYRKADVLVFNEGSACHGVELLGQEGLRRCYVLARRRWNSSFETILEPRARQFANSSGHSFIGSVFVDPRTGRPVMPWGVALFDTRQLVSFFRDHAIARLPHFDEKQYMRAAEAHLHRYLENARASGKTLCEESVVGNMLLTFEQANARGGHAEGWAGDGGRDAP
jgi:hypothetical protein